MQAASFRQSSSAPYRNAVPMQIITEYMLDFCKYSGFSLRID